MARVTQVVPIDEEWAARAPQVPLTEQLTISWENLVFNVGEKCIIKNVSGAFRPGELTAIMGPSGAGKSTMMNVLAGRAPYGKLEGSIALNGHTADPTKYRKKLAYVMQQDALFATQTPRECLHFTAALKLPHLPYDERSARVESAIKALNLGRCADTLIGSVMMPGLSGGEKKRTAVAVELISSPSLIFLDEPTSGLDSHSAHELIKILRELAESGCTIVCTIHQPSSEVFDLFHRVMFLRTGEIVYDGPIGGIVEHFAAHGHHCKPSYNPADFAMQKLQTLTDEEIAQLIGSHEAKGREAIQQNEARIDGSHVTASFPLQVVHLLRREFYQFIRDRMTLGSRFGMSVALALMMGLIFMGAGDKWGNDDGTEARKEVNNHWGALVFFTINAMFLASQPLLLVFPLERAVFMREYVTGTYGTLAYFVAKTLVEVPSTFLQQLVGMVVAYFMVNLQGNFILLVVTLTLLSCVSASLALLIGTATTRAETAVNLVPAVYVPQILFAGFFISSDAIPKVLRWIQWICPLKYGLGIITLIEFNSGAVPNNTYAEVEADNIIHHSDLSRDSWHIYTLIMVGLFLGFRMIAAIVLAQRSKEFK